MSAQLSPPTEPARTPANMTLGITHVWSPVPTRGNSDTWAFRMITINYVRYVAWKLFLQNFVVVPHGQLRIAAWSDTDNPCGLSMNKC